MKESHVNLKEIIIGFILKKWPSWSSNVCDRTHQIINIKRGREQSRGRQSNLKRLGAFMKLLQTTQDVSEISRESNWDR